MWCLVHKWRISNAPHNVALPAKAAAHIATCAGCRRHYEDVRMIQRHLSEERGSELENIPADLHPCVMRAVRSSVSTGKSTSIPNRAVLFPVAAATALVLAAAWLIHGGSEPTMPHDGGGERAYPATPLWLSHADGGGVFSDSSDALHAPIEREMANLKQDVGRAAGFLLGCVTADAGRMADG